MPTDTAVWLYAVTPKIAGGPRISGLVGVDVEPVRHIDIDVLSMIVGTVRLTEFGEQALKRNLEDLDWLAGTARVHDAVISAATRFGPVLPIQLATVYHNDERVKELLVARRQDFLTALDWVDHRDEIGVKASVDPAALVVDPVDQSSSGTAYLMRRRAQLTAQERAHSAATTAAERIHTTLLGYAVDGKQKPPRNRTTVLNGTYLVERDLMRAFRAAVAELGETLTGIELEVTGPWPPYSFTGDVVNP